MHQRLIRKALAWVRQDVALLAAAALCVAVSASALRADSPRAAGDADATPPAAEVPAPGPAAAPAAVPAVEPEPELVLQVLEGSFERGDSLARALARRGADDALAPAIAKALRPIFDFRRVRPGHRFHAVLDEQGELLSFRYTPSEIVSYVLERNEAGGLEPQREEAELRSEVSRIAGLVDRSLHEAITGLGEQPQIAHDFAEIFAWDVDFSRSVRAGDEFRILYERLYRTDEDGREIYVRPGRILAARYIGKAGAFSAVYFEPEEGRGGYYRPDGTSVEGAFLQAPLSYSRISSGFTSARRHPILKVTRPHHGIDYAAPSGTPIWAVANGRVIHRARAGGFGNLVKVRHDNGYVSYYAHLSRYAQGLRVGQRVSQKQVIGYVGQTGLATGPHVCFRIAKDGRYVDPSGLSAPVGPPVPPELQTAFLETRNGLLAQLGVGALVEVQEAL